MLKNPNKYETGKTTVLFIRHGDRIHIPESKNLGLAIPGPGLSEIGKKQAKDVARKLSKLKSQIDALYCSDMTRAIETAEIIGKEIRKKPKIIQGISEFNKIIWEQDITFGTSH